MKKVVIKKVIKWLDVGIMYLISNSKWVSLAQCVPYKGVTILEKNDKNELVSTRKVIIWTIDMDYGKLNKDTRKDHYPIPFTDQMLDRLIDQDYYCFLHGYLVIIRYWLCPRIRKKPCSLVLMVNMLSNTSHSDFVLRQ